MFVGRNDGRLTALDSRDGTKLWEFQTGAGMNAPASVFEHARQAVRRRVLGRQPVRGLARKATASGCSASTARLPPVPPAPAPRCCSRAKPTARPIPTAGKVVYATACVFCHGEQGEGGHGGGKVLDGSDERRTCRASRQRGPQRDAAVRRGADAGADPRRRARTSRRCCRTDWQSISSLNSGVRHRASEPTTSSLVRPAGLRCSRAAQRPTRRSFAPPPIGVADERRQLGTTSATRR